MPVDRNGSLEFHLVWDHVGNKCDSGFYLATPSTSEYMLFLSNLYLQTLSRTEYILFVSNC